MSQSVLFDCLLEIASISKFNSCKNEKKKKMRWALSIVWTIPQGICFGNQFQSFTLQLLVDNSLISFIFSIFTIRLANLSTSQVILAKGLSLSLSYLCLNDGLGAYILGKQLYILPPPAHGLWYINFHFERSHPTL